MRKVKVAPEVDVDEIAGMTTGFTGADLANLVNEAAIVATRRGAESISNADFTAAFERIVAGTERKTRLMNPDERSPRRPSRDGARPGRRLAPERRSGPEGDDHPALGRSARLHDAAPDRGPLSHHPARA
jgi:SpoVK/Ycf46/Vps4 family AAA+-type ATPase